MADSTLIQLLDLNRELSDAVMFQRQSFSTFGQQLGEAIGEQFQDGTTPEQIVAAVKAKIESLSPQDATAPTPLKKTP